MCGWLVWPIVYLSYYGYEANKWWLLFNTWRTSACRQKRERTQKSEWKGRCLRWKRWWQCHMYLVAAVVLSFRSTEQIQHRKPQPTPTAQTQASRMWHSRTIFHISMELCAETQFLISFTNICDIRNVMRAHTTRNNTDSVQYPLHLREI